MSGQFNVQQEIDRFIVKLRLIVHALNKQEEFEAAHKVQDVLIMVDNLGDAHAFDEFDVDEETEAEAPRAPGTLITIGGAMSYLTWATGAQPNAIRSEAGFDICLAEVMKARSLPALARSDINHLRDACRWVREVPQTNPSYTNAELTADHLEQMLARALKLNSNDVTVTTATNKNHEEDGSH